METMTTEALLSAKPKMREAVAQFAKLKILVVGDVGLDEYLMGDVKRISPEAPVPVVEVLNQEYRAGLAANVAQNIQALGGQGLLVGLVGDDASAAQLRQHLESVGVLASGLVVDANRPTTRKVRVMSGQHHVVRVDFEQRQFLNSNQEQNLLKRVESALKECHGMILQDYGKGVLSENLCQNIIELAHQAGVKVVVDPHRTTPVEYYRGADIIKPNRDEAFVISGLNKDDLRTDQNTFFEVAAAIQARTGGAGLLITQGQSGVTYIEPSTGSGSVEQLKAKAVHVPTTPQTVFDVTGAGDTYVATFCLGWFSGLDVRISAGLANHAAGVVVGKIGSVPCSKKELLDLL